MNPAVASLLALLPAIVLSMVSRIDAGSVLVDVSSLSTLGALFCPLFAGLIARV